MKADPDLLAALEHNWEKLRKLEGEEDSEQKKRGDAIHYIIEATEIEFLTAKTDKYVEEYGRYGPMPKFDPTREEATDARKKWFNNPNLMLWIDKFLDPWFDRWTTEDQRWNLLLFFIPDLKQTAEMIDELERYDFEFHIFKWSRFMDQIQKKNFFRHDLLITFVNFAIKLNERVLQDKEYYIANANKSE